MPTMSEKILAKASGKDSVEAGDIVIANIDVAMTHDLTGPLAVESFEKIGAEKVWDSSKIVISFPCMKRVWMPASKEGSLRNFNASALTVPILLEALLHNSSLPTTA